MRAFNISFTQYLDQGSATKWAKRRTNPNPAMTARQPFELVDTLAVLHKGGADLVFIDIPGKIENAALEASKHADIVLIPVRPTPLDIDAVQEIKNLLAFAGQPPTYAVLNCIPSQGRKYELARQVIEKRDGLKVCPIALCQRTAFADAMITGQTAGEDDLEGERRRRRLTHFILSFSHYLNLEILRNLMPKNKLTALIDEQQAGNRGTPSVAKKATSAPPARTIHKPGEVNISAYFPPEVKAALRHVQAKTGKNIKSCLAEAIQMLFRKHNVLVTIPMNEIT